MRIEPVEPVTPVMLQQEPFQEPPSPLPGGKNKLSKLKQTRLFKLVVLGLVNDCCFNDQVNRNQWFPEEPLGSHHHSSSLGSWF